MDETYEITEIFRAKDSNSQIIVNRHDNGCLVVYIQLTEAPFTCSMNVLVRQEAEALIAALTGQEA